MEDQKEEKGNRKIQIIFFLLWRQENETFLNENEITVHDISVPVLTHAAVISNHCTPLGEDIQESQELVLSPLVPHIESIIVRLQKK